MGYSHTGVIGFINNLSGIALLISILLGLLGLAIRPIRPLCGTVIYGSSFVMGLAVWLWCAQIVHALWGTVAMVIGLLFFGVAVVPMTLFATASHGSWATFGGVILNVATVFIARFVGPWMVESRSHKAVAHADIPVNAAESSAL
jgi:hypothetical protein